MARKKKQQESAPGSPAWMATFSDLMNLLLCFFVILFSMSSVDVAKYEEVAASLSKSFSIFNGGKSSIGKGQMVSTGVTQLTDLGQQTTELGKASEEEEVKDADPLKEAKEKLEEEKKSDLDQLYEQVMDATETNKIEQYVNVSIDDAYTYVCLTLSGSVLFDSGSADIVSDSIPILSRVGNILKTYDNRLIYIEGHTDNVPVRSSSKFSGNNELSWARADSVWNYMVKEKKLDPVTLVSAGRSEYEPIASNKTAEGRAKNRRVTIKIYSDDKL